MYRKFYISLIKEFNSSYPQIFVVYEGGEDELGDEQDASGTQQTNWLTLIDSVSDLTKINWNDIWKLNIYDFFNYYVYAKEKNERQLQKIQKLKNGH